MASNYSYAAINSNSNVAAEKIEKTHGNRRTRIRYIALIVSTTLLLIACLCFFVNDGNRKTRNRGDTKQKLLLISLDGFRHDFRQKTKTQHLDWIAKNGVSCDRVMNVFPPVTIPNHQSIVTGLFPENHGLIANTIYDRQTKQMFRITDSNSLFWNNSVPIWIDNEIQGHMSGNCFWPGYDTFFNGRKASYLPPSSYSSPLLYDRSQNMPWNQRIDLAVDWLKYDNVTFVSLYIGEPDHIEHKLGPDPTDAEDRKKLKEVIREVDDAIGRVLRKVKEGGLESRVNIIIMGDHGQTQTDPINKVIDLTKYVDLTTDAEFFGDTFIYPKPGKLIPMYAKLKKAEDDYKGYFKVYLKKDIPDHFHIRNHKWTGEIMLLLEPGWMIWLTGQYSPSKLGRGKHYYSNQVRDMNPAFFAVGPLFRANFTQHVVHMVDVYPLMCDILQIKSRKHDGDFKRIRTILVNKTGTLEDTNPKK